MRGERVMPTISNNRLTILIFLLLVVLIVPVAATTYTVVPPPEIADFKFVNATSTLAGGYVITNTFNNATSLTGAANSGNIWIALNTGKQRVVVDFGTPVIIRNVSYVNYHSSGASTTRGAKNFTLQGSNTYDLSTVIPPVYANMTDWTNLTTETDYFKQHVASDVADKQSFLVDNTEAYRYYSFMIHNNWGDASYVGMRRIELMTEDGYAPSSASFDQDYTEGFYPLVVTFNSTSTGTPDTYNYSIYATGGSPTLPVATTQNYSHLFSTGGNFTINLTTTYGSSSSTATGYVEIWNHTQATFAASNTSGTYPLVVGFTPTGQNYTSSYWDYGDGNTSTTEAPTYIYYVPGTWTVKHKVNNTHEEVWDNTTVITVSLYAFDIVADFIAAPDGGTVPLSVSFTDTTVFVNATPAIYAWNFTDGNTSALQNPTNTFVLPGNYNVSLTVSNVTSGLSDTVWHWVNVTTPSGFNQQDIELDPAYTLLLHIRDAGTGAAIPVSIITASTGVTNTTSIGDATFWFPYSVAVVYVSSDGYRATSTSYLMDRDREETISLTESPTIGQNANTLWSPFAVAIQVIDGNMNPIIGVPVRLTAYDSSLPGGLAGAVGYFQDTYGANNATAAAMLSSSTTYNGTTDDYGFISTQVVSVIQYRIVTQDTNGVEVERLLWPHGSYYQINTGNATTPGLAMLAENRNTMFTQYNASFWEPNSSYGCMGVRAYDSEGSMAHVYAWWKLVDNGTIWWTNTTVAGGYGPVNSTKCVPIVPYQQWKWGGITD